MGRDCDRQQDGLGYAAAGEGNPRSASSPQRSSNPFGSPNAGFAVRVPGEGRKGGRSYSDRRSGRRGPPAGNDRRQNSSAGDRCSGGFHRAEWFGRPFVDRSNAERHSGGHDGDRQSGSRKRRAICGRDSGAESAGSPRAAAGMEGRAPAFGSTFGENPAMAERVMSHPGASKRQKELARAEKRRLKEERREQRRKEKADKLTGTILSEGEDPDIAGIVPGPQPPLEE